MDERKKSAREVRKAAKVLKRQTAENQKESVGNIKGTWRDWRIVGGGVTILPTEEQDAQNEEHERQKIEMIDNMYQEALARRVAKASEHSRREIEEFERAISQVKKQIEAQKAKEGRIRRKAKPTLPRAGLLISGNVIEKVVAAAAPQKKGVVVEDWGDKMDSIVTAKIELGQSVKVYTKGVDTTRTEVGPQVLILSSSEKLVGATFTLNSRNASFKPEFMWQAPTSYVLSPDVGSGSSYSSPYSFSFDTPSSSSSYSFSPASTHSHHSYSFSFDTPTEQRFSYDIPESFTTSRYGIPNYDDASVTNGNRYSFSTFDDHSSVGSFGFEEEKAQSAESPAEKLAHLLTLREGVERVRTVFSEGFISEAEFHNRIREVTNGKWEDDSGFEQLESEIEELKLATAAPLKAEAIDSPKQEAEARRQAKQGKSDRGGGVRRDAGNRGGRGGAPSAERGGGRGGRGGRGGQIAGRRGEELDRRVERGGARGGRGGAPQFERGGGRGGRGAERDRRVERGGRRAPRAEWPPRVPVEVGPAMPAEGWDSIGASEPEWGSAPVIPVELSAKLFQSSVKELEELGREEELTEKKETCDVLLRFLARYLPRTAPLFSTIVSFLRGQISIDRLSEKVCGNEEEKPEEKTVSWNETENGGGENGHTEISYSNGSGNNYDDYNYGESNGLGEDDGGNEKDEKDDKEDEDLGYLSQSMFLTDDDAKYYTYEKKPEEKRRRKKKSKRTKILYCPLDMFCNFASVEYYPPRKLDQVPEFIETVCSKYQKYDADLKKLLKEKASREAEIHEVIAKSARDREANRQAALEMEATRAREEQEKEAAAARKKAKEKASEDGEVDEEEADEEDDDGEERDPSQRDDEQESETRSAAWENESESSYADGGGAYEEDEDDALGASLFDD